jgi:hypothetical protein
VEGHLTDLAFVRAEIADTLRHLDAGLGRRVRVR